MLKYSRFIISAILVSLVCLIGQVSGEDPKKEEAEKIKKVRKDQSTTGVISRAYDYAHKMESLKFIRLIAVDGYDINEESNSLCIIEFSDGSVGIYLGGTDAKNDQFIIIEKARLKAIEKSFKDSSY